MERSRQQRRWNTGQLMKSLDESQLPRSVEPSSSHGRNLASRLGMTEVSCFPSSRSRRASNRMEFLRDNTAGSSNSRRRMETGKINSERGKGIRIINNELAREREDHAAASLSDEDEQVFDLSLLEGASYPNVLGAGTSMRSLSCKRKSSSFVRGSTSTGSGGSGKAKMAEEQALRNQRGLHNLRRSSTSIDGQRLKVSRRNADAPEGGASSSSSPLRLSRDSTAPDHDRLLSSASSLTRRPAGGTVDTRGRSRNYDPSSSAETVPRSVRSALHPPERSTFARRDSRETPESSSQAFTKRNISNCFGSGRRSPSPRPIGGHERGSRHLAASSSNPVQAPPSSLLSAALEAAATPSSSSSFRQQGGQVSSSGDNNQWSTPTMASGWEYHRPRLMAEGLAKILLALERVENDEELTHELLMLEATVLFGGMAVHDRHSDWRMDVDNMTYEELLALEEKMGNVSIGVSEERIAHGLQKCRFSTLFAGCGQDGELKCSICQEEYRNGEQLGRIECGHKFHIGCIKQWLGHKNLCPICKATAVS
ncbi:probable E3 ubiquitin-protein ligase HIP1 isoform X2 [Selaginella moellendorffii]|uniref:probable E3 ubiquitin-protein ligase HIP1 isoform X2 n=1 Tax=Selaginella moellendorffii TaxID=88036 RepID=UPI000D1CB460|nr:probable E3 ubiquitin-protein ligase HIP1 isoform X2 [Selaginella moellendorffii]|eukprot:XP_002976040.2 probable E3 ubiquitin-protein ligase HIP1 isoform X2 [Selaginella moellendorffii]